MTTLAPAVTRELSGGAEGGETEGDAIEAGTVEEAAAAGPEGGADAPADAILAMVMIRMEKNWEMSARGEKLVG